MFATVLLSGGIDSSTCLALAVERHGKDEVCALNITYGQKHAREIESAEKIAAHFGVSYRLMDLSAPFQFSDCPLLKNSDREIEKTSYADQLAAMGGNGTVSTYVPFRNGVMLSTAAAYAQSVGARAIYYGAHADDAAGSAYPDCTPEFVTHMQQAILSGTGGAITLYAPFIECTKDMIVAEGLRLRVPYELTWSCYEGKDKPCGQCGTCRDRQEAFRKNGVEDPLSY